MGDVQSINVGRHVLRTLLAYLKTDAQDAQ